MKEKLGFGRSACFRRAANTSVTYHNGKLLALVENDKPYWYVNTALNDPSYLLAALSRVRPTKLQTVGSCDFEGQFDRATMT